MSTIVNTYTITGAALWAALVAFAVGLCRRAASQDAILARLRACETEREASDA